MQHPGIVDIHHRYSGAIVYFDIELWRMEQIEAMVFSRILLKDWASVTNDSTVAFLLVEDGSPRENPRYIVHIYHLFGTAPQQCRLKTNPLIQVKHPAIFQHAFTLCLRLEAPQLCLLQHNPLLQVKRTAIPQQTLPLCIHRVGPPQIQVNIKMTLPKSGAVQTSHHNQDTPFSKT